MEVQVFAPARLMADERLVAEAQAGDQDALELLISAVRPAVLRYCRARLGTYAGGMDAADDAAQETCVALIRVLPRYQRQGAPFAALVYAVAAHKVADVQRRFGRSALLVDELPDRAEPSPTPEEHVIAAVDQQSAHRLLERLSPRMRQVLLLRADGASADRVGDQLGMSANAVRVTQHRAAAKVRQLLEESDEHRELFASYAEARRTRPAA